MSMPKYALHDFIELVPECVDTTRLSIVLEIFSKGQCDRLVVVSEQQCPIGVLHLRRLMPQLMSSYGESGVSLDVQQPVFELGSDLVEPILTIPAELSVEQLGFYLSSQQSQTNTSSDWALIDEAGKFLGLLDSPRLLQFLVSQPAAMQTDERERECVARCGLNSLVQLLERLPWPLVLQTSSGEVVAQNSAWWQQFGALSDPEAVRREVEAILKVDTNIVHASPYQGYQQGHLNDSELNYCSFYSTHQKVAPSAESPTEQFSANLIDNTNEFAPDSSRCQLGTQPNTCICILPVQNGQERVWQFVKIPLQESQGKSSKLSIFNFGFSCVRSNDLWILLAQDVTEQQQLCKELAAKNADLIQLNRLKDEFLACISHELKTPLTAVLGLSTLLKDQALGKLNDRQARYARLIHQSGRHLMMVVNDILDLTRMETGQLKLTLDPVQIRTVCNRAIEQARAIQSKTSQSSKHKETLEERPSDHRFTLLIEPGLDIFVADELRLRQMLVHLLANAFKFTEAGGEIGLRVSRWEGWIAFTVWDTGIGIPEQKQHLIFQKFQQLENPLTRQFEGTGLGLVLTRALARLHGGDVSFLSKEGKGSQFTLLLPPSPPQKRAGEVGSTGDEENEEFLPSAPLPLDPRYNAPLRVRSTAENSARERLRNALPPQRGFSPHGESGSSAIPTPQNHRNRLVLVVEAAPRFIEDLTEHLTSLGYRVVIARSGTEALEKARRLQPGAVFLNPLLPLLSGWDVLTLLKSDMATCQIPVIVTATQAEKNQAFSNRADDFLSLPVQQQVVQQILSRFCAIVNNLEVGKGISHAFTDTPLTILRLITSHSSLVTPDSLLLNYRVLEADNLEQAELLARVWQPHVILVDSTIRDPLTYLQQLSQHPSLKGLPLVTLDAVTTQAANQVTGLSVFPCLTPLESDTDGLLPVLQLAAGMSWKPSLLVVNVATLPDLDFLCAPTAPVLQTEQRSPDRLPNAYPSKGSEWFQALIQYLQTAGLNGMISHSWAEVVQQIQQQSVDLLLLCLKDSSLHPGLLAALTTLGEQQDVPPILVLDQRLGQTESNAVESLDPVLGAIATRILPSSLSMEELLDQIHQTLAHPGRHSARKIDR